MKNAFFAIAAAVVVFGGTATTARAFDVFLPSVSVPTDTDDPCTRGACVTKGN